MHDALSSTNPATAALFRSFGLNPATEIRHLTSRPYRLADGEPLRALFESRTV